MDFNIKLSNGQVLKGIIQSPGEDTRGVILFIHGIGEHIQRYNHWAEKFKNEHFAFAGVDLPGHGRSDGRRGNIKSFALLAEMIDILLKTVNHTFPRVPVYLYGHSMGGGIVLDYLIRKSPRVQGAIVTSPWLKLAFEPANWKLVLATVVRFIMPGLVQPSGLNVIHLSHDTSVNEIYQKDPLVHNKISVSCFLGAMEAAKHSLIHASELKTPVLLIHGSGDMICSPEGSREFAGKTEMAELKIWNDGYHELHNEPFRDEVFSYIMAWLKKPNPKTRKR